MKDRHKFAILIVCGLVFVPFGALQVYASEPAIFSTNIRENMVLWYEITELGTPGGQNHGVAQLGPDSQYWFMGANLSIREGDLIRIKVDTINDSPNEISQFDLVYTQFWIGFPVWTLKANVSLYEQHEGKTDPIVESVTELFSRLAILPLQQQIEYPPYGLNETDYYVSIFGQPDDNGTNGDYKWNAETNQWQMQYHANSTYYMFLDAFGFKHLAYNKIPAILWTDSLGNRYANWSYAFYDDGPTYTNATATRWTNWAMYDGFPYLPYAPIINVVTDTATGIAQWMEIDFSSNGALNNTSILYKWGNTSLPDQLTRFELTLESIVLPAPGFETSSVVIILLVIALPLLVRRRQLVRKKGRSIEERK
ncbi:MAG: hypothetical protein ACFFCZ_27020 [Promethearchaeota archaeon]